MPAASRRCRPQPVRVGAASYWISFGHKPRPRRFSLAADQLSKIKIKINR
ncbi:hypothetical protein GLA29479_4795 [Lysobacter antibioticus]|nr:hypothetical protein GLA29479_4795 [Lysobacter antibioticus]